MLKSEAKIQAYGGFIIKAFGEVKIECIVDKNKYIIEFIIIIDFELKCHIEPLVGLNDC